MIRRAYRIAGRLLRPRRSNAPGIYEAAALMRMHCLISPNAGFTMLFITMLIVSRRHERCRPTNDVARGHPRMPDRAYPMVRSPERRERRGTRPHPAAWPHGDIPVCPVRAGAYLNAARRWTSPRAPRLASAQVPHRAPVEVIEHDLLSKMVRAGEKHAPMVGGRQLVGKRQ